MQTQPAQNNPNSQSVSALQQDPQLHNIQINIGSGHEFDFIAVKNITNKDFTTYWGKEPYTVASGQERILLRYIAVKFARELADRLIYAEADRKQDNVIKYLHLKPKYINAILLRVDQYYKQSDETKDTVDLTEEERKSAESLGEISVLDELGILTKPVRTSIDDIRANMRPMTEEEKRVKNAELAVADDIQVNTEITQPKPVEKVHTLVDNNEDVEFNPESNEPAKVSAAKPKAEVSSEMDSLIKKATALGIEIPDGATPADVKQLIVESL